ncbi:MAG: hypothetical protein ABW352_06485 [Polyangiales bacterium]
MRGLLALVTVLAISVVGALVLANNLAHPWVRERVVALVRDSAGYQIEYRDVQLRGLTLQLDGLVVHATEPLRRLATPLLRAERVTAHLSPSAPQLRLLRIEKPRLTVVIDEHGRTSFDTPPGGGPAKPPTPLSRQAASLLGGRLPVRAVQIDDLDVSLLRAADGRVIERDTLRGLRLDLEAEPVATGTRLSVKTRREPIELRRTPRGHARGTLALALQATAREATLSVRIQVAAQDLVPALAVRELARIEAHATFANGQSAIDVRRLELGDEAVNATAALTVPDQGAPHVRHARGDVDALHVLELAAPWLPGVRLRAGKLHYRVEDFTLDRPATQAKLAVDGELDGLELEGIALGLAKVQLQAKPSAQGLHAEGQASLDRVQAEGVRGEGITLQLAGTQDAKGAITGEATLRFAALEQAARAREGELVLRVRELVGSDLASARGDVKLDARIASVEAPDLTVSGLRMRAHSPLNQLFTADATLEADNVRTPQLELPLQAELSWAGNQPTQGRARLEVHAAGWNTKLDATRRGESVDYELDLSAPDLVLLEPWLATDAAKRMPLASMATSLHSKGQLARISGAPRIRQRTELRMHGAALDDFRTRDLELELEGHGDVLRHQLRADLRVKGLQYADQQRDHDRVQLTASFDRVKSRLELALHTDKRAALAAKLAITDGVLDFDVEGKAADLTPLAGLLAQSQALAGFDVSELDVDLKTQGKLTGVIRRADARGIEWMEDPLLTLGGQGTLSVESKHFRWAQGDMEVGVPVASWKATLRGDGARRTIESDMRAAQVEGALGSERVTMADIFDHTTVSLTGGIKDGVVEHAQQVTIRRLEQHMAGGYAVGDVEASLHARREADGLIKIGELRVDNRAGGTRLSLSGGVQLSRDEQRLSVRSLLEQDLSRLPALFEGRGKLTMDVTLSSSDFRLFHSASKLKLEGATVRVPRHDVALESIDGELPVVTDFLVGRDGVELLRGARINPYAAQRFADQHPALGYRSFMSIARVHTPYFSFAPFAANLEVARNIVSLSQVELGVRNGIITGSGMFEYDGLDSKVDANLRASGVESSHGEPFDGNAALSIGLRERSVEGRADILRIGRRHLTDLLDMQDPLHADPAFNAIRRALRFGYPDRVKLSFQHGFANAGVEFGGLARLVKLNDIRGIPLGPLMERIMSSIQPQQATP